MFAPLAGKTRIFRRRETDLTRQRIEFPTALTAAQPRALAPPLKRAPNLQTLADQLLPARVFAGGRADHRPGRYPLCQRPHGQIPGAGRRQSQLEHLCHGAGRIALRAERGVPKSPAPKADSQTRAGERRHERRIAGRHDHHRTTGRAAHLARDGDDRLHRPRGEVSSQLSRPRADGTPGARRNWRRELERAQLEVQSMHEEMQTSQEELHSANEELQSTNEELQSANEELTTSKEELQSMNEELQHPQPGTANPAGRTRAHE